MRAPALTLPLPLTRCAPLPHRSHEAAAYASALEGVGTRLRALPGSLKPAGLGGATEAAWRAACAALDATPSDAAMCERLLVERGYEEAFSSAQALPLPLPLPIPLPLPPPPPLPLPAPAPYPLPLPCR